MEKKLVCKIQPFIMQQTIFIIQGRDLREVSSTLDTLAKDMAFYANSLNINNILLKKNGYLAVENIKENIIKIMAEKYNNNLISIIIE